MILAVLELTPGAARHAYHIGLREVAPAIFILGALLIVIPLISDARAARRRDRADREDV